MSTPVPPSVVEAFCADGTPGVDYNVIPVPSQVSTSPELASFATGFPPATRTPRNEGGIPPRGTDMNGILRMLSAHTAWVAAGGAYAFNADVVSVAGGYPRDAILRSVSTPLLFFYNTVNNNTNDPDVTPTGWVKFSPLAAATGLATIAPSAGTINNQPIAVDAGYLDVDTTAGNVDITGFAAAFDGQSVVVSNTGANLLQILALNAGSAAGNQVRIPSDMALVQNQSATFKKSASIGKWVLV